MKKKIIVTTIISVLVLLLAIRIGSVEIPLREGLLVLRHRIFGIPLPEEVDPVTDSIFWNIRLPRALTAYLVGGALSVSGAVMQAILQNPLASSYTLGVSSGASLGAALVIISGITVPALADFLLPVTGFAFGLLTVVFAIGLAAKLDHNVHNQTIILIGMVLSLFVSAILTLMMSLFPDHAQQLYIWMMGSFASRNWPAVGILAAVGIAGTLGVLLYSRELDIMTFGAEQSMAIGVDVRKVRNILILLSAVLTGISVSFTGTIGFIDLVAPHVVRRIFGAGHRVVIPMSYVCGGAFMALADLLSRTVIAPREIPVGAVTALIGAPFFAYIYFRKRTD